MGKEGILADACIGPSLCLVLFCYQEYNKLQNNIYFYFYIHTIFFSFVFSIIYQNNCESVKWDNTFTLWWYDGGNSRERRNRKRY